MKINNIGYLNIAIKALNEYCNCYEDDECDRCPFRKTVIGCPATIRDQISDLIYEVENSESRNLS